jgi:pimeloyl-ACP methyl ester carboxylesterase
MAILKTGEASIYYEVSGKGFPVLLLAAGANESVLENWHSLPKIHKHMFDPYETIQPYFTLVAMDQRNAGQSRAPIRATDSWMEYAQDQFALMDHLGYERFHVFGACIGAPMALLLYKLAPKRIVSAVMQDPIGATNAEERKAHVDYFNNWAEKLVERRPDLDLAAVKQWGLNMYEPDFAFAVPRSFMPEFKAPMLVLPGNDIAHPTSVGEDMANLSPHGEIIADWKQPGRQPATVARVTAFLREHTPK